MQITAIEKNNRKKKNMKKAAISATVIFAMMTCLSFAYATSIFEAVGDALFSGTLIQNPLDVIVSSFLLLVFKTIIQCVVNVLDIVISPINEITTMKMAELAQYLPFAEYKVQINEGEFAFDYTIASKVNDYIIGIGVLIWILLSCFAILIDFYYVASGDKRAIPGSKLFLSITITGVLTYKAQDLMFFLFDNEINPLISEFLDIAQKDQTGIFENMGNSVCTSWQGVPGILIALVMVLMIGINYIKLALEMVQRYLIVAVICVLSPLAFATGSNQETADISKKWFRMFWSQCVLLFLNVWCVYVVREGMMAIGDKKANQLLIWGLIVYGFIKVAQQLDDLLQNAGLSITRQTSGMLEDFLMMGKSMIGLASTAATAAASGFQFKQDSANLREGLANGTKTMDDYKRHIANTTANMARNPLALAMMAPQMLENAKHQIVQKEEAAKLAVQQEEERQKILNSTTYVWSEVSTPTYGQSYASITCDEIGLSSRLYWGDDQSMINTAQGVYEYTGTSQIGYPGCHLLAAHNNSVFSLLQYASVGDIFTVTTEYGRYAYEVDSCRSGNVTADAGTIVASDGTVLVNLGDSDDRLYMYTCYPFGYYGATNQRYVVRATLIPESETINLSALSTDDDGYMSKESHQK